MQKPKKRLTSIKVWPYLFCLPFVGAYLLFNLYPTLYSFYLSFFEWNGVTDKVFVGLQNYIGLLGGDKLFWRSLGNTIILMAISTPLTVALGMLLANWLFNVQRGRLAFQTINFFPYITTPVAIGFIFSYMFDWQSGYVNQFLTTIGVFKEPYFWLQNVWASRMIVIIMVVWRYLGYYMTIYFATMTSIPQDVYEAARVDGAGKMTIFFKITVPMLKNITMFLVVTSIIGGLQMFEEPLLLFSGWANIGNGTMGGPGNAVLTTVWKFYNDAFRLDTKLGYSSAIAYALFFFIIIFTVVGFKLSNRKGED